MTPPLVLLHGFTHTGRSWDAVGAALAERYRAAPPDTRPPTPRASAPDIRGHGAAADRRPIGFDACTADVVELLAEPSVLCGYSMGGRLALHAALAAPRQVAALVLIGATPGIEDPSERADRAAADAELADELAPLSIEELADRWAQTPVLGGQPPDVAAAIRADRLRNTPSGLVAALRGIGTGTMTPLWSRLDELTMPVTLIVGERDTKFRGIAERMFALLPSARLAVVPDAGHAVHLERPAAVAAELAAALGA